MEDVGRQELGFLARVVIALAVVLIVAGVLWHGVTVGGLARFWHDLVERPTGPMKFRFILQPSMAAIAAIHDGMADARAGRAPYFATVLRNPHERVGRLREGLNATARIILLGLAMDMIYQALVLETFYPVEALLIALLLAFVPYVIIRGLFLRALSGPVRVVRSRIRKPDGTTETEVGRRQEASDVAGWGAGRFEVRMTADTHWGWIRTRLSVERTMMSWVRTAVSLIGFGFAIVQFFERLRQMPGTRPSYLPDAPRFLGLALILCGILALLISIWQYWWTVGYLWNETFAPVAGMKRPSGTRKEGMQSPIVGVATLLVGIGLFAFLAVLFRLV